MNSVAEAGFAPPPRRDRLTRQALKEEKRMATPERRRGGMSLGARDADEDDAMLRIEARLERIDQVRLGRLEGT